MLITQQKKHTLLISTLPSGGISHINSTFSHLWTIAKKKKVRIFYTSHINKFCINSVQKSCIAWCIASILMSKAWQWGLRLFYLYQIVLPQTDRYLCTTLRPSPHCQTLLLTVPLLILCFLLQKTLYLFLSYVKKKSIGIDASIVITFLTPIKM